MKMGYMKPSYLLLVGVMMATLLFYAVYVSSAGGASASVSRCCNDTPAVAEQAAVSVNRTDSEAAVEQSSAAGNASLSTASLATADRDRGVHASSIYVPGHLPANPAICPDRGDGLQLLVLVASAPAHKEARMAVRQTWGHYGMRRDVSIAFVVGAPAIGTGDQLAAKLDREDYVYGDLIRGRFVDTYDNLTLKTISMLEWADAHCPGAAFMLKTDDDMFINVARLLTLASKRDPAERVIYGRLAKKWKPIRNARSKYYVSRQQYKPAVFPDFTTGPAYLVSRSVVGELYRAALGRTYFKLEDVFMTGIVAHYINVQRMHVNEFLNKRVSFHPCNVQKGVSIHMVRASEQFDLWKKLLDGRTKCPN